MHVPLLLDVSQVVIMKLVENFMAAFFRPEGAEKQASMAHSVTLPPAPCRSVTQCAREELWCRPENHWSFGVQLLDGLLHK